MGGPLAPTLNLTLDHKQGRFSVQLSGPGPSRKERLAAITDAHTYCTHTHKHTDHRTPKAQSSEASSICDSSKSLADIDLVPRLAAHSGRVELSGAAGRS